MLLLSLCVFYYPPPYLEVLYHTLDVKWLQLRISMFATKLYKSIYVCVCELDVFISQCYYLPWLSLALPVSSFPNLPCPFLQPLKSFQQLVEHPSQL